MSSALTETQVANRALQRIGPRAIADGALWTEDSQQAAEIRACYHILRRAEQRRNVWTFATRRVALRPIDTNSKAVTFATWSNGTTYAANDIVVGSDGLIYRSLAASNTAHDPTTPNYAWWDRYYGTTIASEFVTDWSSSITYALGDHAVGTDGTVYISLSAGNLNHNPINDGGVHWDATTDDVEETDTSFYAGELVFVGNAVYLSLQNSNEDVPPSSKWLTFTAAPTVALPNIIYPIGAGPFSDTSTRNIYQLPNGYLRTAPQAPKVGSVHFLGAPSALAYTDWEYAEGYIVTTDSGPIVFRFGADVADPAQFDAMFVEGFASRIALEMVQRLTEDKGLLQAIASEYKQFMGEARTVNAIEQGPTQAPEDDYISCRV